MFMDYILKVLKLHHLIISGFGVHRRAQGHPLRCTCQEESWRSSLSAAWHFIDMKFDDLMARPPLLLIADWYIEELVRANYAINIFLTDEEPHCLQFGSSITCAKNKTNKVQNIKYKYYGFRFKCKDNVPLCSHGICSTCVVFPADWISITLCDI